MFPTSRISTQIHYRKDKNLIGTNLVDETEGKAMGTAAPCPDRQRVPCIGVRQNSRKCGINLVQEDSSKSPLPLLVTQNRLVQLCKRRRSKSIARHSLRDERRSWRAAGPSTAGSSPRSYASIRSSDSAAHFVSISLMRASSRLSQSRSINIARSRELS